MTSLIVVARRSVRSGRRETRPGNLIGDFEEVHLSRSLADCIKGDVKGLYAKALSGEIRSFTGVSDPYEPPLSPELRIETRTRVSVEVATECILAKLAELGYLDDVSSERDARHSGVRATVPRAANS